METCGEEHGRICEKVNDLEKLWDYAEARLPKYVFVWAVFVCLLGFSAMAGWIGYVQGVSAQEMSEMTSKFEKKTEKLTEVMIEMNLELAKLNIYLREVRGEKH